jgi:protein-S-isoprenylcysteine O-methyltransferase Ste14
MFWLILSVLLWGLLHSLLASFKAKQLVHRRLGERAARFYRLAYNVFSAVSFLPVLALAVLTPDRTLYQVRLPWSALMIFGEFLATVVLLVGFFQTDVWEFIGLRQAAGGAVSLSNGPVETKQGRLVTRGLYRYVRHPLYTAGIAFIWLMPLMTVNVLAINIALTVYVVIGAIFEERKLRGEFGQAYADYAARTPMFLPFTKWNKK